MGSLSLIGELVDGLPAALTTSESSEKLRRAIAWWPNGLLSTVFLECRLGPRAAQVDALVGFRRQARARATERERAAFARGFREWRAESCLLDWFQGSMVPRLEGMGACVSTGPGDAGNAGCGAGGPTTMIYADLTGGGSMVLGVPQPDVARATASEWIRAVRRESLSEEERVQIDRCFDALEARNWMRAVGVVLTERPSPIRYCVAGLRGRDVGEYLSAVGTPCDLKMLEDCIADIGRRDCVGRGPELVHIDVGARMGERVGLEYRLKESSQEGGGLRACRLLAWLSSAGLCTPGELDELVKWPSGVRVGGDRGTPEFFVRRAVGSIKVSVAAGRVSAKAYLMHRTRAIGDVCDSMG